MSKPGDINTNPDEISINEIFGKARSFYKYFKSKWLTLLIFMIIGSIAGLGFSIFKKVNYSAVCTFVLEDGDKGGDLSQYAGIASLAGISLGGGGGLFEGDNILELYKSRLMIEKTLLSTGTFNGRTQPLIDRYIEFNKLRPKWRRNDKIDTINFNGDPDKFNRTQDSIITDFAKTFNLKNLAVYKPDKKLSVINVEVRSNDELFAKVFADKLVENVNTFFVQTKTKKSAQNVLILQHQADSVKGQLNSSIGGVASAADAAPNANPLLSSLKVPSQRKLVDVQASTAVYSEIVKNLEISKISLRRETPLIQLIDTPILPLENNKLSKIKGLAIGLILGFFIATCFVFIKSFFSTQ